VSSQRSKVFSLEELARFNGTDASLPIYLSITGLVFDVTHGSRFYGPGKTYAVFAGRDASRAFVTGCFSDPAHLTLDLRGLAETQLNVSPWHQNIMKHHTLLGLAELGQLLPKPSELLPSWHPGNKGRRSIFTYPGRLQKWKEPSSLESLAKFSQFQRLGKFYSFKQENKVVLIRIVLDVHTFTCGRIRPSSANILALRCHPVHMGTVEEGFLGGCHILRLALPRFKDSVL